MVNKNKDAIAVRLKEGDNGVDIPFRPSDLENVDYAMYEWLKEKMHVFSETSTGWKDAPVLWVSAERAVQIKKDRGLRDDEGALILPIITVERTGVEKDLNKKGAIQANLPEINDALGGVGGQITIAKKINASKTGDFANAASSRKYQGVGTGGVNFNTRGKRTSKVVYDIYSIPTPVYVTAKYEISIRTEYQGQMNEILTPFVVYTGGVNQFILKRDGHKYEAFVDQTFAFNNSVGNLGEEERIYQTKLTINVLAYLLGEGANRDRPKFARRENAVEIRLPRERVMMGDIPDWSDRSFFRGGEVTPTHQFKDIQTGTPKVPLTPSPRSGGGGGGGGTDITAKDESVNLTQKLSSLNFVGGGVTATTDGNDVTVTVDGSAAIPIKDEGVSLTSAVTSIDFTGAGLTATADGDDITVNVDASAITAKDEGVNLTTSLSSVNFVGAGVTATTSDGDVTVTITGSLAGDTINQTIVDQTTYNELPAGLINGINTVYTLSQECLTNSLLVFNNGILMRVGAGFDYTITADDEITFTFAPAVDDFILVSYVNKP